MLQDAVSRSVKVSNLKGKLLELLSRDAALKTFKDLAERIGTSKQHLNKMMRGDGATRADMVPRHQFRAICSVFFIEPEVLLAPDLATFQEMLPERPSNESLHREAILALQQEWQTDDHAQHFQSAFALPWHLHGEAKGGADIVGRLWKCVHAGESVLLLGESGAGKTATLTQLAFRLLTTSATSSKLLPLFLELWDLPLELTKKVSLSVWASVCESAFSNSATIRSAHIRELMRAGRFVLLLDGLDELPSNTALGLMQQLRKLTPNSALVVSCRRSFFDRHLRFSHLRQRFDHTLEIDPINPRRAGVARFIAAALPVSAPTRHRAVVMQIQSNPIATNPLALRLLLEHHTRRGSNSVVDATTLEVFRSCIEGLLQSEAVRRRSKLQWQQKLAILKELAWIGFERTDGYRASIGTDLRAVTRPHVESALHAIVGQARGDVRLAQTDDILLHTLLTGGRSERWRFVHFSFQDFLAAAALLDRISASAEHCASALSHFIPPEVDVFLRQATHEVLISPGDKRQFAEVLDKAYRANVGNSSKQITLRDHILFYYGRLELPDAKAFLEGALAHETNSQVVRSLLISLALHCSRDDCMARLIHSLKNNKKEALHNLVYFAVYYGDAGVSAFENPKEIVSYSNATAAMVGHLRQEKYRPHWPLDLLTLQHVHQRSSKAIPSLPTSDREFLNEFIATAVKGTGLLAEEARKLKNTLRGTRNLN